MKSINEKIEKYLNEAKYDPMHGGDMRRAYIKLAKTIDTFMQETMVEIDDEILEMEKIGRATKEDIRRMKTASDEAHEKLKYLRGMFRELQES